MTLSSMSAFLWDCVIVATALVMAYRAARYLMTLVEDRWLVRTPDPDPAATAVWDVLAEARRITETGDHDATR